MNVSHLMRGISRAALRRARTAGAILLSLGILAGAAAPAQAEGFWISEWSARGMGLGGGVAGGMVGRADDPSAVVYNPAGITQIKGTAAQAGMALSMLNIEFTRDDNGSNVKSSRQAWPIPHGYLTHQLNDDFWLGIGMYTKAGLGSQFPDGWGAPSTYGMTGVLKSITLLSSTINPNIAYRINDTWSVAAGLSYTWGYLSLNQRYSVSHPLYGNMYTDARIHSENGYAFGWNAAVHAKFSDEWSAGLTYRSHEDLRFKGMTRFRYGSTLAQMAMASSLASSHSKGKLRTPDVFTAGLKYQPLGNLSFEADLGYTVWSRYRSLGITMPNCAVDFFEQKDWHDTWALTLGAEYSPLDWLTLRAGFTYETSPLKNTSSAYYDYLTPSNGRNYYTLGVGFKYDRWTMDLAYMYIRVRGMNYSGGTTSGVQSTFAGKQHNTYANNLGLTIGYRF